MQIRRLRPVRAGDHFLGFNRGEVLASPSNIETFVLAILGSLGTFVGTMRAGLIFLLFIVLEEHTLAKRFRAAFPHSTGRASNIVRDSTESISAYVVSKVTCSGGQAAVMTLILSPYGFDIPGWFLFGVPFASCWASSRFWGLVCHCRRCSSASSCWNP
ncbi:MAG: hypothetical protein CM15mP78_07050 [Candidatus Poseidoniales archaeon]|nr:MAG: hypothetical protein CM15mP78_07050 [Candidatus Poseidoniales archaeon]